MELYAVRYAKNFKYATYQTVYRGNESIQLVPEFIFLYYIAKYGDRIILFDTGFRSKKTASDFGIDFINSEGEAQKITKGKVDIIFITHAHFDHTDNLDRYPEAEIILSEAEYQEAFQSYLGPVKEVLKSDRIHLIKEEYNYENQFYFQVIAGHTKGSSVIYFNHDNQQYVISGDEGYLCDNFINNIPNGNVYHADRNERFIAKVHEENIIPLPFHDNKIFEMYTPVSENIVRII